MRQKNTELMMKCRNMEELVASLKKNFIQQVGSRTSKREPVNLDLIMAQGWHSKRQKCAEKHHE